MVSPDLEKSLRDALARHSGDGAIDLQTELRRLQTQIDDAFSSLIRRATDSGADGEASAGLASTVSEHLHHAYTQGIEEAAAKSSRARASSDVALIKAAVDDIDNQRTQTDILNALVNRSASFAPRIAFFIIKNNRATGWRARGLEGTTGDDAVREISLDLDARTLLSEVVESSQTWSGGADAHEANAEIYRRLGGDNPPERCVAVPLVARNKTVAALYADSANLDSDAINLEALEALVRVAGMAVELLATQRPASISARTPPAPQPFVPPPPASVTPAPRHSSTQPFTNMPPLPAVSSVMTDAQSNSAMSSPAANAPLGSATPTFAPEPPAFASPLPPAAADEELPAPPPESFGATTGALDDAPQTIAAAPEPAAPSPLGAARQYGRTATPNELPVDITDEEEKRLHNDARRFARLLVSEIKLYNEQKVREGRASADIYTRLREEIDRSREMYDKRVRPEVAARFDYFHTEVVNTLAEGEGAKLGAGYPGATVS